VNDQLVWAAMVFPTGSRDIVGALYGSPRLHWTEAAARTEAQVWADQRQTAKRRIEWHRVDEVLTLGRVPELELSFVVRGILLPLPRQPRRIVPAC
jgi:hypothetical protein